MKNRIRVNGWTIAFALCVCAVFPYLLIRRTAGALDAIFEISGIMLILLGQMLRASARGYKAERSDNGNALVTDGPYALVRNPMYLGIVLIGTGIVFAVGQLWALALFLGGFFFRYLYLFRKEEAALTKFFGAPYAEYTRTVPRIIPSLKTILTRDPRNFLPLRMEWFARELPGILAVLAAVMLVESWEEVTMIGWRGVLPSLVVFMSVILFFILVTLHLSAHYAKISGNGKTDL